MALDLPDLHAGSLDWTRGVVAGVPANGWDASTPCAEWNVRELVNHIVSGNLWAGELGAGKTIAEVGDRLDGDVLGDDPLASYDASAAIAADVFRAPGAMERMCAVSYGPVPGEVYAGHRFIDVLIHGWDAAKATGQDTTLAPALVEGCWAVVEPQLDLLEGSGMFASGVEAGAGADPETRLLAALGRHA